MFTSFVYFDTIMDCHLFTSFIDIADTNFICMDCRIFMSVILFLNKGGSSIIDIVYVCSYHVVSRDQ